MKKILFVAAVLTFASCKKDNQEPFGKSDETSTEYSEGEMAKANTPEEAGKLLFEGKGNCTSCHQPDQNVIGPSISEIAKIYKEKNGNMVAFLKGDGAPIVDPSQFEIMKTNFPITKTMTDEELKSLESYIFSHLK
jgi:cytochrome c